MSNCWLIHGIVHEKPRPEPLEYVGEDVYHPNQPTHGQIDELLLQFTGKHILVIGFDPSGCDSAEEVAEEVKKAVLWSYECRQKDLRERPQKKSTGLMIGCEEGKKCPDRDVGGSICWFPLNTLRRPCDAIRRENKCPRGRK